MSLLIVELVAFSAIDLGVVLILSAAVFAVLLLFPAVEEYLPDEEAHEQIPGHRAGEAEGQGCLGIVDATSRIVMADSARIDEPSIGEEVDEVDDDETEDVHDHA